MCHSASDPVPIAEKRRKNGHVITCRCSGCREIYIQEIHEDCKRMCERVRRSEILTTEDYTRTVVKFP